MLTAPATGLALLMLLALGTFVAGVHVSWHICALGIAMALCVPVIAWLTESALFLVLGAVALIGIGMTFWWRMSDGQTSKPPRTRESLD
jgi:membrane protein implicated in regulation of membrane protease activity